MNEVQIRLLLQALPGNPTLVETHISWVLMSDDRVYKIRKPMRYAFLDFSTMAQRRVASQLYGRGSVSPPSHTPTARNMAR